MTCRAARKALPLLAGDDLGPRKAAKVRAHVATCPSCRREADAYAGLRSAARALARADAPPAWSEAEWRAAVRGAVASAPAPRRRIAPFLKPSLAYGLAVALTLGGAAVTLQSLRPHRRPEAALAAVLAPPSGPVLREPAGPHLTRVTVDPKDGRVRLVWRFGRDLPPDFYGK